MTDPLIGMGDRRGRPRGLLPRASRWLQRWTAGLVSWSPSLLLPG